ncbi:hypothetical protein [Leifsonia xyli]|uniref:hypothetical protein n=1 Tax=Leifsonia xyli TaxID=1575 RepID=UPI003D66A6E6
MPSRTSKRTASCSPRGRPTARPFLELAFPLGRSRCSVLRQADREEGEGEAAQRADQQRERQRPDADVAAQHPPDDQHGDLDRGAHHPDRTAGPCVQAGHQPVARSRTESRTDVEARRDGEQHEARGEEQHLRPELGLLRQEVQPELRARPDQQHVQDGAQSRPLPQRDPERQHHQPDEVGDQAERDAGLDRHALREHVPRREPDAGAHHERDGDPVEEQADQQLHEAAGEEQSRGHGHNPIATIGLAARCQFS